MPLETIIKKANPKEDVWLVYDGECPVCKTYYKYIRIRKPSAIYIWLMHASPVN